MAWNSSPLWYTHLASIYYLIRMDKMLKQTPWFQFLVRIVLALQIIFLQSFAVLYITVCINCEGPEIRCKELL